MKKPVEKEYLKQQFKNFFTEILDKNYLRKSDYNPGGSSAEVEELTYDETMAILNGSESSEPDPYEVAPPVAVNNWNYTLDDDKNIITLNYYTGSETDVIVYGSYVINEKVYKTQIKSNVKGYYESKTYPYMFNADSASPNKFPNNKNIKSIKFSRGINTDTITNMDAMFYRCESLVTIEGLDHFDTSNVTSMAWMFCDCKSLTSLDLSNFDTSQVTDMKQMFYNSNNLSTIYVNKNKWIISQATTTGMFSGCGTSSVTYK